MVGMGMEGTQGQAKLHAGQRSLDDASTHTRPHQRLLVEFLPRIEDAKKRALQARGMDMKDAWYLAILATDPDYEGRGQSLISCPSAQPFTLHRVCLIAGEGAVQGYWVNAHPPRG